MDAHRIAAALSAVLLAGVVHGQAQPAPALRTSSLKVQFGAGDAARVQETALDIPAADAACALDQAIPLPEGLPRIRVTKHLPAAVLAQEVVEAPAPEGKAALLLAIAGPTQSHQRWLVAGDAAHSRIISLIGTWTLVDAPDDAARDALFQSWQSPPGSAPELSVRMKAGGAEKRIKAAAGETLGFDEPATTVRVLEYLPHFSMNEAHQPANASDRPENPAARVRIERGGKTEERWVFAKMPDFNKDPADALDIRLEAPAAAPGAKDFCLAVGAGGRVELWSRDEAGSARRAALEPGALIPIPGSRYGFRLERSVASGRLIETWNAAPASRDATSVILLEVRGADERVSTLWLPLGIPRPLEGAASPVVLTFQRRLPELPPGHPTGR